MFLATIVVADLDYSGSNHALRASDIPIMKLHKPFTVVSGHDSKDVLRHVVGGMRCW